MISVIIPAYNEGSRIGSTLVEISEFIKNNSSLVNEVVLVDDGSIDSTVEVAMYYSNKMPLKIVRLLKNSGKWAAIHEGISVASNDMVLLLDADGSASINELSNIDKLEDYIKCKATIFGSRFLKGSSVEGKSFLRKVISLGYRVYVSFWYVVGSRFRRSPFEINDFQCPFKLFSKSKIDVSVLKVNRFAGDIELALNLNSGFINRPVNFVHVRGSKISSSSIFSMAFDTAKVGLKYLFRNKV